MTDTVKAWIKERRAIHREGWSGKWSWSLNDTELATLRATGGHVDFDLIRDDEYRGPSEVLDEIVDAHNVTVPRALDALSKVLELHTESKWGFCTQCMNRGEHDWMQAVLWPCPTVRAIEGAIKDG